VPGTPDAEDWTPAAVPMERPAGRPRRSAERPTAAERVLKSALRFGLFVNAAALVLPRFLPAGTLEWRYGGDDFWALPGGSVEAGEFSAVALVREVFEEVGVKVACGGLLWVIENLFEYRGTHYTEFGFYYEAA